MTEPRYLYFSVRARGELPRLVAAYGGIKIVDERLNIVNDWPGEYKEKTPFGQVPCLILGEKWYGQKLAISLYFARQCGLYPTTGDALSILQLDSVLQYSEEILENIVQAFVDKKMHDNPAPFEKLMKEVLPVKVPRLEAILKANGSGFLVGDKVTIVDLSAFDVTEHVIDVMGKEYLDNFPLLKAHFQRISDIPGIKSYFANRPKPLEGFEI